MRRRSGQRSRGAGERWFACHAIRHALAAEDFERAARLVGLARSDMDRSRQSSTSGSLLYQRNEILQRLFQLSHSIVPQLCCPLFFGLAHYLTGGVIELPTSRCETNNFSATVAGVRESLDIAARLEVVDQGAHRLLRDLRAFG